MPRKKNGEFDQNKYLKGYIKDTYYWVNISFRKDNKEDMEIYEYLKTLKTKEISKTPYIKDLIRKDMENDGQGINNPGVQVQNG